MTTTKYDVLGIGNAIFDVLVQTDEGFLSRHGMTRGMALIDEARAASIYRDMGPATKMSGGSAANTIVGIASLGARRPMSARSRTTRSAGSTSTISAPPNVAFETGAAQWSGHRLLLHPGDAGRRAHHEHLSRRGAGTDAAEIIRAGRGCRDRLSRRLSLDRKREGSLCQSRDHRAWRGPPGRALPPCRIRSAWIVTGMNSSI